ncbi:MAG: DUF2961 domain-containing protein [Planctomycetes bacterium]|nr:DUF2961 domain-containing protein [Planctomycetota bacterium]
MRCPRPVELLPSALCALLAAQQPIPPDSVARLIDLAGLPRVTPGVVNRQFASTDPTGQGHDHGHFLRRDGNRVVLAEMDGPGVIVRLWSANAQGRLRVYCDGEEAPRIDGPFADLFTGKLPPFAEPIAVQASGGFISYFPIPYARHCRVEVHELEHPESLYYHVQYLTYPAGTPMRTFTGELPPAERDALGRVLAAWRQPGANPDPRNVGDRQQQATTTLPPGGTAELLALDRPGTITGLEVLPDPATPAALRGLQLHAAWDGAGPSVRAPIGDLFGCGFGVTPWRGLALGYADRGGYCHLPMPFQHSARLALHNRSAAAITVQTTIRWQTQPPPADALALHAEFRAVDGVGHERYAIAEIAGPGRFLGLLQALQGVGDLWYLEGNEEFFVDGEATPSILGTGSEDYYNGGWYWDRGTFALPLHGLGMKAEWTTNRTTPWRLQLPDAVPFTTGFRAQIEHGSRNEVRDGYYSSVALWYGRPTAVRAIAEAEERLPRQWVFLPNGFTGASQLTWAQPLPELRTWEQLTDTHRGLTRPLFQAFPRSHVEHDAAPVDARVAALATGDTERTWRATFTVPWNDRWRLQLRLLAPGVVPAIAIDGKGLQPGEGNTDPLPLRLFDLPAGALSEGDHELTFTVPAGASGPIAVDALRVLSASPFVRTWWVAPPAPFPAGGTIATPVPAETAGLAADFDPVAAGWRLLEAPGDSVDLNHAVSSQSPMFAYLLVHVHASSERTVRCLLGSDDGARVWVNGELRWSREIHRHLAADEDQFDAPLRAGWNRVLLKIKNDYGGYGVMLRLADPDGGLRVAAGPR